ncbi:hypothetical protein ACJX0J_030918, partial [Zea mays]
NEVTIQSLLKNTEILMESMHILLFTYRAYIVVGIYIIWSNLKRNTEVGNNMGFNDSVATMLHPVDPIREQYGQ